MLRPDMVTDQMNRPDVLSTLLSQVFQAGEAFLLPLACLTLAIDLARPGRKGRTEVEGASACVLVLRAMGPVLRLRWPGRSAPRPRLPRGLRLPREDDRGLVEWPRVEIDPVGDRGIKVVIAWVLGIQPEMRAPGLPLRRGQEPADGRGRDVCHEPSRDTLPRQRGTIPLGEATAEQSRAFAGQAHDVDGARRGENRPWRRGQERQ
jgi:hypothetical protein